MHVSIIISVTIYQHEKAEVTDLFGDFCNGKSLLAVLEILSGTHLVCIVLTSSSQPWSCEIDFIQWFYTLTFYIWKDAKCFVTVNLKPVVRWNCRCKSHVYYFFRQSTGDSLLALQENSDWLVLWMGEIRFCENQIFKIFKLLYGRVDSFFLQKQDTIYITTFQYKVNGL